MDLQEDDGSRTGAIGTLHAATPLRNIERYFLTFCLPCDTLTASLEDKLLGSLSECFEQTLQSKNPAPTVLMPAQMRVF
jgi:hypothetical protein